MFQLMRVGDEHSFVEFSFKEAMPEHLPGGTDIACSAEASCGGFRGRVETVWFSRDDINLFLSELRGLEERRQGSANLTNMSSQSEFNPLSFEILSVDGVGHMALSAELLEASYVGSRLCPLRISVGFPIDAGSLPSMLVDFRKLFESKRGRAESSPPGRTGPGRTEW